MLMVFSFFKNELIKANYLTENIKINKKFIRNQIKAESK